jgi:hypothetical protein
MILWVDKHVPRRISEASAALGHAALILTELASLPPMAMEKFRC